MEISPARDRAAACSLLDVGVKRYFDPFDTGLLRTTYSCFDLLTLVSLLYCSINGLFRKLMNMKKIINNILEYQVTKWGKSDRIDIETVF